MIHREDMIAGRVYRQDRDGNYYVVLLSEDATLRVAQKTMYDSELFDLVEIKDNIMKLRRKRDDIKKLYDEVVELSNEVMELHDQLEYERNRSSHIRRELQKQVQKNLELENLIKALTDK